MWYCISMSSCSMWSNMSYRDPFWTITSCKKLYSCAGWYGSFKEQWCMEKWLHSIREFRILDIKCEGLFFVLLLVQELRTQTHDRFWYMLLMRGKKMPYMFCNAIIRMFCVAKEYLEMLACFPNRVHVFYRVETVLGNSSKKSWNHRFHDYQFITAT